MPSTRISICLICALDTGLTIETSRATRASFFVFIVLLSLSVHPKLLCYSKTDMTANGHEGRPRGMRHVPIHPDPDMHSGTHPHIRGDSGKQHIAAAPVLRDSPDTIILRMQPSQRRANEPFTGHVLRFIRSVRQPEA